MSRIVIVRLIAASVRTSFSIARLSRRRAVSLIRLHLSQHDFFFRESCAARHHFRWALRSSALDFLIVECRSSKFPFWFRFRRRIADCSLDSSAPSALLTLIHQYDSPVRPNLFDDALFLWHGYFSFSSNSDGIAPPQFPHTPPLGPR